MNSLIHSLKNKCLKNSQIFLNCKKSKPNCISKETLARDFLI